MKKSKTTAEEATPATPAKNPIIEQLEQSGSATISAQSREELAEILDDLPADVSYAAGAVGQERDTGRLSLTIYSR